MQQCSNNPKHHDETRHHRHEPHRSPNLTSTHLENNANQETTNANPQHRHSSMQILRKKNEIDRSPQIQKSEKCNPKLNYNSTPTNKRAHACIKHAHAYRYATDPKNISITLGHQPGCDGTNANRQHRQTNMQIMQKTKSIAHPKVKNQKNAIRMLITIPLEQISAHTHA